MKMKLFLIIIILYILSFISIKYNINLFYPFYYLKDIIYYPVKALDKDIELSNEVMNGINSEKLKELEELKKINNLSDTLTDYKKVTGVVIERNKMYWFNTITINKGKSDGIKENMAVVSGNGLIGRINKVGSHTSEIKLITTNDTNHKISVMLKTKNDILYGILSGYNKDKNVLEITSINKNIDIDDNTSVYTSGMGGIFPSGILIGNVSNIINDKYDVSKIIEVTPSSDINNTKFVNVLIRNIE